MDNYFIHTFELSYRTTLEDILELTDHKLVKINGEYKSTKYVDCGLTIISRRCKKEGKDGKGNHKLILIVNPSKLIKPGSFSNNITCGDDFEIALVILDKMISSLFLELELDDFKLSRIDITNDVHNVPESIIQEYILIMRKMSLSRGYRPNTELEKNTPEFRCEDSFNVCNVSQGAEFVAYNKHRASIDQGYPQEVLYSFEDTMRVELRFSRRYINRETKGLSTSEALLYMYLSRADLVKKYYDAMFRYRTDLCYVSERWQGLLIEKWYGGKKKARKLKDYIKKLSDMEIHSETALYDSYNTKKVRTRTPSVLNDIGFSPIPIQQNTASYMSPLDIVLGFSESKKKDKCYKFIKHSKGRKKVIFRYEDYRIHDDR
ncbi:hypothetical protein [Ruminococcus albus]|uniref:Replication-associated protein G2P N-terminal domain-containing protein n=1 Tax=Ruminococcus albus 8 TaxID=246199 RepID=E9SFC2_RUMAL|nr:hypothetical protein [Ruminococcus albus]EGC02017.1 hypothetical protein CUS_4726 [Ruminococcus albus 8]MCC3351621.1 hypothetical protein [Ruminococcus albus 8]